MKYSILLVMMGFLMASCSEPRQEEQDASYNDFFMSRGERAKSVKDQNFSASPSASGVLEEERIQSEEEVLEGIIPEAQEDQDQIEMQEPRVNGASETEYLQEQENKNNSRLKERN